jgi:hypothetical protein
MSTIKARPITTQMDMAMPVTFAREVMMERMPTATECRTTVITARMFSTRARKMQIATG